MTASSVRALGALTAGMLALGMTAGCAPEPAPKPTKAALFTSDEEAFAAAEQTYRAYTDALNSVDAADPHTFEAVFALTTGDLEDRERKNLSVMHAERLTMVGDMTVTEFAGISVAHDYSEIVASLCLDVSATDIVDETGQSLVPAERPDVSRVITTIVVDDAELLVAHTTVDDTRPCDE